MQQPSSVSQSVTDSETIWYYVFSPFNLSGLAAIRDFLSLLGKPPTTPPPVPLHPSLPHPVFQPCSYSIALRLARMTIYSAPFRPVHPRHQRILISTDSMASRIFSITFLKSRFPISIPFSLDPPPLPPIFTIYHYPVHFVSFRDGPGAACATSYRPMSAYADQPSKCPPLTLRPAKGQSGSIPSELLHQRAKI